MLCQVMPVDAGKRVCSTCWRLSPSWVKHGVVKGEPMDWSQLQGGSIGPAPGGPPPHTHKGERHADRGS